MQMAAGAIPPSAFRISRPLCLLNQPFIFQEGIKNSLRLLRKRTNGLAPAMGIPAKNLRKHCAKDTGKIILSLFQF